MRLSAARGLVLDNLATTKRPELPTIAASAAMGMDFLTGAILYEKDPDTRYDLASLAKLANAILVVANVADLDATTGTVTAADVAIGGTTASLLANDVLSIRDLLYGMLLPSGNDAANCLGRTVGQSAFGGNGTTTSEFITAMNSLVSGYGFSNTLFATPHGGGGSVATQYISAREGCKLFIKFLQSSTLATIAGTASKGLSITGGRTTTVTVKTTVAFLSTIALADVTNYGPRSNVIAGKTGTTGVGAKGNVVIAYDMAGSTSKRSIHCVLDSTDATTRFDDMKAILGQFPADWSWPSPTPIYKPRDSFDYVSMNARSIVALFDSEPNTKHKAAIDTLVSSLESGGIWAKLDCLYVLAAHSAHAASINWKMAHAYDILVRDAPVFTADRGYAGDATDDVLSTIWNPTLAGVNWSQDSACLFGWSLTNRAANATPLIMCGQVNARINNYFTGALTAIRINASTSLTFANAGDSTGLYVGNRTGSVTVRIKRNDVLLGTDTTPSAALSNTAFRVLGNSANFTSDQIPVVGWSSSLSTGEETALYNALLNYLQTLGAV